MYTIFLSKSVEKFLDKHPEIVEAFDESASLIALNPKNSWVDVKKMIWSTDLYRLRIGKYRFLYRIIEEKIVIYFFDAGSRGDIYK